MTIDERLEFLTQSAESHDRQIGELTEKVDNLASRFDTLAGMMGQLLGAMKTLAETATDHEHRISGLEGKA